MSRTVDLSGQVFGRLTVLERAAGKTRWLCRCECGTLKDIRAGHLQAGTTRSCGCLQIELTIARSTTHGMRGIPEYKAWNNMKDRCYNPNAHNYADYGGRGITVCDRWVDSFENFYADMGPRPAGKTLERSDNSKGYNPDNCIWETPGGQARNRRSNRTVQYLGQEMCVSEAARLSGIRKDTLRHRILKGWPSEHLFLPTGARRP